MHNLVVDLIKFNVIYPSLFLALASNERNCKALKQCAYQRGTFSSFSAVYIFSVKGVINDTWITFRDAIAETGKYARRLDKLLASSATRRNHGEVLNLFLGA